MFRVNKLAFFLVAHCLIFSLNQPFRLGRGGMHMAGGGDAQGGGCTCILCIPSGYAPDGKQFALKTKGTLPVPFFCCKISLMQYPVPY